MEKVAVSMATFFVLFLFFSIFAGMKALRFLIAIVLLWVLAACAKQPIMPPPQEDLLYQVEGFFPKNPDSALKILDTLNVGMLSKKERAHYCLLKVMVRDLLFKSDNETDSLLQVAENYFIGGEDKYFESMTCEELARLCLLEGKGMQYRLDWQQKALQSIEKCLHVDKRLVQYHPQCSTEQEFIDIQKHKMHWRLGMAYVECNYQKEAILHLKKVADHYDGGLDYDRQCVTFYALGEAYLSHKDYDSSLMYFQKGLEMAEKMNDKDKRILYYHSMSKYYRYMYKDLDFEDEEERTEVMRKSIAECWKGLSLYEKSMFNYKDGFYSELSSAYGVLHQYDSCIYYAKMQLDLIEKLHFRDTPHVKEGIYLKIYKSYESTGNADSALSYANKYLKLKLKTEMEPQAVEQVKNEYDKKLEMMQLQNEQQGKRYRLYLLLVLTFAALVVVLWLGYRYRKNKEIEILRHEEAYRKLQSEFEAASQQAQKSQQAFQQRVMAIYKSGQEDRLKRILAEFDTIYPQAFEKLQNVHTDLTETECKIVVLSFFGFRIKEEAELLDLSVNTVAKYRTNIRKKMGSDPISRLFK